MKIEEDYRAYIGRQEEYGKNPAAHYWFNQEERYIEPFRLYGDIYYVGDSWVCVHIIDTGDGLLLIDAGNCGAEAMLIHSIWSLGFNPADVKWIILSHGHLDHFGAAMFFRRLFGTKIYLGAPDAEMFRKRPELSIIQDNPDISRSLFEPDNIINDGDVLSFGKYSIECKLVPGHTPGCVALFFDAEEDGITRRVGYFGGFGLNTLKSEFLKDIGDTDHQARRDYINSLMRVRNEKVDVFLGNHTQNNDLINKLKLKENGSGKNPFIDSKRWSWYMDDRKAACMELED